MIAEAWAAIRSNFAPGLVLWAVAGAVVAAYYLVPPLAPAFAALASWKAAGGLLYSLVATAVFAGLVPVLVQRLSPRTRPQADRAALVFATAFWAYRGVEIDLLYQGQAWLLGTGTEPATVALKVAVDLLVYNVLWATSLQLLAYHWKNSGFRGDAFRAYPWRLHVTRRVPVALLTTWSVWLPVLVLVYSLPPNLQIPLFNLAACFWALVVASLTRPS